MKVLYIRQNKKSLGRAIKFCTITEICIIAPITSSHPNDVWTFSHISKLFDSFVNCIINCLLPVLRRKCCFVHIPESIEKKPSNRTDTEMKTKRTARIFCYRFFLFFICRTLFVLLFLFSLYTLSFLFNT